jgi:hypothetical protein
MTQTKKIYFDHQYRTAVLKRARVHNGMRAGCDADRLTDPASHPRIASVAEKTMLPARSRTVFQLITC